MKSWTKYIYLLIPPLVVACGGPHFKATVFQGKTEFSDTVDPDSVIPLEKIDPANAFYSGEPPNVRYQTLAHMAAVIGNSYVETAKYNLTVNQSQNRTEIAKLKDDSADDTFMISDKELETVNQIYLDEDHQSVDPQGYVKIPSGKSFFAKVRPLVIGRLYEVKITNEANKVAINGVLLRQSIAAKQATPKDSAEATKSVSDEIFSALKNQSLQIKTVKFEGRQELVQLSTRVNPNNEIISRQLNQPSQPISLFSGIAPIIYQDLANGLSINAAAGKIDAVKSVLLQTLGSDDITIKFYSDRTAGSLLTSVKFENVYYRTQDSTDSTLGEQWEELLKAKNQSAEKNNIEIRDFFNKLIKSN